MRGRGINRSELERRSEESDDGQLAVSTESLVPQRNEGLVRCTALLPCLRSSAPGSGVSPLPGAELLMQGSGAALNVRERSPSLLSRSTRS